MLKRSMRIMLSLSIGVVLCMMPTVAAANTEDFSASLVFEADYLYGEMEETTGNFSFKHNMSEYLFDEIEGVNSVLLDTLGNALQYKTFDDSEIPVGDTATYEVYFFSNDDEHCHLFMAINSTKGIKFEYDPNSGFGFYNSDYLVCQGTGDVNQYLGKWTHLVTVVSGGVAKIYLNGIEIASGEFGGSFDITSMDAGSNEEATYNIGFARGYDNAATAEEVMALYEACPVKTAPGTTPAAPTKMPNQPNTNTFDMGILSLAAVGLSSAVAVKKRKNR